MSGDGAEGTLSITSPAPTVFDHGEKIIYVEFEDGDQRNPQNFPLLKKWAITLTTCYFTGMTAAASSSFTISTPSMTRDLHCTELQGALGLGLYAIGFGVVPLVTSSFSEEVGRRPVYIFSSIMFILTQVMVALAPNIQTVLAGRALGGIFGSTGASLVGGSIADIWKPQERGLPMTVFAFVSLFAIGLGSVIGGVIQSNPALGWRWVQWIHIVFSGIFIVLVSLVMSETRPSIILIQIARSQRKLTGNNIYKAKAEIDKEALWSLIKTSCTRPLYFLLTEPIVQSISVWSGFTWGVVYCLLEAISPMFEVIYGFNVQQTGYVYITAIVGATVGCFASLYQDRLYRWVFLDVVPSIAEDDGYTIIRRHFSQRKQEARLYLVCVAALWLPIGMFIFAWTASPKIHWIVPIVGLTVFMSGVMVIFQVAFLYLADWYVPPDTLAWIVSLTFDDKTSYNTYASSAQAGQTLFRTSSIDSCRLKCMPSFRILVPFFSIGNTMALVFPLFTQQMFATLTYKWALTLFAILALLLAPTPFVLFFYGSRIRARSIASQKILAADAQLPHAFSELSSSTTTPPHPGLDKV
ncbi:major facilitator superfamily domain-containing protein [Butyriboletus roseoflavus]|nr:major facilitator superfamily domain-containing protein [Butyriboletus roseoflavus]